MLVVVAVGVGLSYFVLGWVSNTASVVGCNSSPSDKTRLTSVSILSLSIVESTFVTQLLSELVSLTTLNTRLACLLPA
jgi:hypothetical protein